MRKINIEVEAAVALPVKVTLGLLVRANEDANLETVIKELVTTTIQIQRQPIRQAMKMKISSVSQLWTLMAKWALSQTGESNQSISAHPA